MGTSGGKPTWTAIALLLATLVVLVGLTLPGQPPNATIQPTLSQRDVEATGRLFDRATYASSRITATAERATEIAIHSGTITVRAEIHATETSQSYPTGTAEALGTVSGEIYALGTMSAILGVYTSPYPLEWPMAHPNAEQIVEARMCNVEGLVASRYPETLPVGDFETAYRVRNTCDMAALAGAYAYYADVNDEPVSEAGKLAYLRAVSANPALLFDVWLMYGYWGEYPVVEAPPLADQPITTALLRYSFGGIGYRADASVIITSGETRPVLSGVIYTYDEIGDEEPVERNDVLSGTVNRDLVQGLGAALTDLVPIDSQFEVTVCYDYYPDWSVLLVFEDGTVVSMATNGSNMLGGGGPWQARIGDQSYVQMSSAFPLALARLADTLDMPGGATAGMICGTDFGSLTLMAYP